MYSKYIHGLFGTLPAVWELSHAFLTHALHIITGNERPKPHHRQTPLLSRNIFCPHLLYLITNGTRVFSTKSRDRIQVLKETAPNKPQPGESQLPVIRPPLAMKL